MTRVSLASTRSGSGPTDSALVFAARGGESWAKEALFRRHLPMVGGLAYRLLGRDAEVDDIVQETFAAAFAQLAKLRNSATLSSWLAGIAVRTTYKLLRRRRILHRLGLRSRDEVDWDTLVSPTAPPDVTADLLSIYGVVQDLPPRLRVPLILRRVDGLSLEQIASLTGASLASVKRRLTEADRLLQRATTLAEGQ